MAQTDVTSTYLTNPDFEGEYSSNSQPSKDRDIYQPSGWTLSYTNSEANDMTSLNSTTTQWNNFSGKPQPANGGSNTYWIRFRWGDSENLELSQTVTLPAGKYTLSVDAFLNGSTKGVATISAAGKTTNVTNNTTWGKYEVSFSLIKSTEVKIACSLKQNKQEETVAAFDNFTLTYTAFDFSYATPVANNTTDLYFKNETTGQFLSAGHTWGTHATVDNYGQEITATVSEGIYSLKTQQYNKYVGGLYMDSGSANEWVFRETSSGSGKYYMTQDGINYLTSNGAGAELVNVTSPTDASIWTIVSKADRKTALSSATVDSPIDATFLLQDPNFGRNNVAYSNWTWTFPDGENKNNAGKNENFVVECYHKQFTFKTTLAAGTAPAGVYGVTAQGFYRQDGGDNDHLPVFYVNSEEQTFPARTGSEGSMEAASESFSAGSYTIDPIYIRIENEDAFEVGAKLADNTNLWCIWDNFQLKYYGDVTVATVKMKASVDAYNAAMDEAKAFTEGSMFADAWTTLQSAITANTVNLNDPALTEETLTTATANLVAANTAATAAVNTKTVYDNAVALVDGKTNVDLTSLVSNASFEDGNLNGWTSVNGGNVANNDNWAKVGTYFVERWTANGETTQSNLSDGTLTHDALVLPAGLYTITAKAQNQEQKNGVPGTGYFLYANDEKVEITGTNDYSISVLLSDKSELVIKFALEGCTGNWISCDNIRLTYVGEDFPAYTKATGKMDPAKSAAQDEAEETFNANKNVTNYNALIAAIANAEASVANYAALKAAIDKAEAVKNANNFVTADATTTFESAISTATNGWTDVTFTDAQCTTQITTLGTGVSGWHANATGAAGVYMTSTWGKTSGNWWTDFYINTWSTEGDNDGSGFSVPFFEYYADNDKNLPAKTMTATLTGLDNGIYEVALWARAQRRSDADFNGDNTMITMSVNGGDAVSIMSGQSTVGTGTSVMRLGRYTATGIVTDGTLTLSINVKLGANVHWLCWRDVTYTKVAPATVSATIGSNGFTTFASPYALDLTSDAQTANSFKAYRASAVNGETVTFKDDVDQTVVANTGVLLQGTANAVVTIPVVVSGSALADNALQVNAAGTTFAADANITYYGMNKDSNPLTFGTFDPSSVAIPASKAYLALTSNAARSIRVVFGDITGVANVEAATEATLKDGKYLENGKIVIVKNGQKFNANGQQVK